jgi:trimeric autotransporter adhesin
VRIVGGNAISVTYNAIGVGIGGVALGNAGDGIHVAGGAKGVTTGFGYPSLSGAGIASAAYNGGAGLYAEDDVNVDVTYGSFGSNAGLGIDLARRGVNPNDMLDADVGPNELLNTSVLQSAAYDSSAFPPATITGTLDTTASVQNEIDFYVSESCDPSGYGEGEGFLGFANVTTDASGHAQFSQSFYVQPGLAITALTRRFSTSDPGLIVSEFSNCTVVGDEIFANGFGP